MSVNAYTQPSCGWRIGIRADLQTFSVEFQRVKARRADIAVEKKPTKSHPFS